MVTDASPRKSSRAGHLGPAHTQHDSLVSRWYCCACGRFKASAEFPARAGQPGGPEPTICLHCGPISTVMPPKIDTADDQQVKKRRGRPPGPRRLAQEEVQALRAQHAAAQQAGSDAEDAADVPVDALLLSDPHEMARRYQSLLQASTWIHKPQIRLNGRDAELLGGHKSDLDALFVRCVCGECLLKSTSGAVFSMEEFFTHSGLDARCDTSAVLVMQEGVQPVPLSKWLPAAAQHLGGPSLVGQLVYMYWYGQPRTYNGRITSYGRWYVATIREYLPATGEHRLNYKEGATWSSEDYLVYLPLAHVHFGSKCPAKKELPCSRPPHVMPLSMVKLGLPPSAGLGPSAAPALQWPATQPPPQPPPAQPSAGTSAERTQSVPLPPVPAPQAPRPEAAADSGEDATQTRATKRVRRAPAHLDDWPPQHQQQQQQQGVQVQVHRSVQQATPWSSQGQISKPQPAAISGKAAAVENGDEPPKKRRGRPPGPKRLAAEAEARARAAEASAAAVPRGAWVEYTTKGKLVELDDTDDSLQQATPAGQQAPGAHQEHERQARLEAILARQHRARLRAKQHQQQDGTDIEDEGGEGDGAAAGRGGTRRDPDGDQGGPATGGGRGGRGRRGGGSSRGRGRAGSQGHNRSVGQSIKEGGLGERQHSLGLLRGALALADVSRGTHDVLLRVISKCPQYAAGLPSLDLLAHQQEACPGLGHHSQPRDGQGQHMPASALPLALVGSAVLGPTSGASTCSGYQMPGAAVGAVGVSNGLTPPRAGTPHTTSTSVEMPAGKAGLPGMLTGQASPTSEEVPILHFTAPHQLRPAPQSGTPDDMPGQQAYLQGRKGRQSAVGPKQQQVMAAAAADAGGHPQDGGAGQIAAEAALAAYLQRVKAGSVLRGRGGRRARGVGRGRGRGRTSLPDTASDSEGTDPEEAPINRTHSTGQGVHGSMNYPSAPGCQQLLHSYHDMEDVQDLAEGSEYPSIVRGRRRGRGRGRGRGRATRGRGRGAAAPLVGKESLLGQQVHWADAMQPANAGTGAAAAGLRPSNHSSHYPDGGKDVSEAQAYEDGKEGEEELEDQDEEEVDVELRSDRAGGVEAPGSQAWHQPGPDDRRPHNLDPQARPKPPGATAFSNNSALYGGNRANLAATGSGNYRDWSGPSAPQPSDADLKQALAHLSSYLQSNRAQTTAAALAVQQRNGHGHVAATNPSSSAAATSVHDAPDSLAAEAGRAEAAGQQPPDMPSAHAAALATLAAIYHENPYLQSLLNYQEYQRRSRRWNRRQHAMQVQQEQQQQQRLQHEPGSSGGVPWAPRSRPPALNVDLSQDCRLLDPAATLGLATVRTSSTGGGLLLSEAGRTLGTPQTTSLSALLLRGHSTVAGQAALGSVEGPCEAEGVQAARCTGGGTVASSRGQQHGLMVTTPSLLMACATASAGSPRAWPGLEGLHDELVGQHSWGDTLGILQSLEEGPESSDTWSADDQGAGLGSHHQAAGLGSHHVQRHSPVAQGAAWPALAASQQALAGVPHASRERQESAAQGPIVRLNETTTILMPFGQRTAHPPFAAQQAGGREAELETPSSNPRGSKSPQQGAEHLTAAPSLAQFLTQAQAQGGSTDALATALAAAGPAGPPAGPSDGTDPALSLPIKPLDLHHSSSQLQLEEQPTVDLQHVELQVHRPVAHSGGGDASALTGPDSSLLLPPCLALDPQPHLVIVQAEHAGPHRQGDSTADPPVEQQAGGEAAAVPSAPPGHDGSREAAPVANSPHKPCVQPVVYQQPNVHVALVEQQVASQQGDVVEAQPQPVPQDEQEAHSPLRQQASPAAGVAAIAGVTAANKGRNEELLAEPVEHCIAHVHLQPRDPWPSHSAHSHVVATLMADSLSSCARHLPMQCSAQNETVM